MQAVGPALQFNALPILAKAHRERAQEQERVLLQATQLMAGIAWPIYILIAFFPAEIIRILYGTAWVSAAELVPWIALSMIVRIPFTLFMPALQGSARPFTALAPTVVSLALRVAVFFILPVKSLPDAVQLLAVADILGQLAWGYVARRALGVGRAYWFGLLPSLQVALLCAAAAVALRMACRAAALPQTLDLLLPVLVYLALAIGILRLCKHPAFDEIWAMVRKLR
jgi:O-antigen/teichoic acid export membrane protein